jgi:hypothetical protein
VDAQRREVVAIIRALIRFHFNEWDYNTHWGGDGLEALFYTDNPILHYDANWPSESFDDAISHSASEGYEGADVPISLFAGYDADGEQCMLLEAIKSSSEGRVHSLRKRARQLNHFLLEPDVCKLLGPHVEVLERAQPASSVLYRARIGYAERRIEPMDMSNAWRYRPYAAATLGAPPPPLTAAGRLNRPGVAFLYLASDEATALNEVRPHPGQIVSIGAFKSHKPLRVADFNAIPIRAFCDSDEALDEFWMLKTIDRLFSLPVPPDQRDEYVLTQLLSDAIRQLGFDGVAFNSSVGSGVNYAFFDASGFDYVENSGSAVEVAHLSYSHRALELLETTVH